MVRYTVILGSLLLFCLASACTIFSHPQQNTLKEVLEHAHQIALEAELTGDTSPLTEVFTEEQAKVIAESTQEKLKEDKSELLFEETEIDWVKVIEYEPPEVIVEIKYFYRVFSYEQETGERIYHSKPRRYWRIWQMRMMQEDGIWKVDEALKFVDWSG